MLGSVPKRDFRGYASIGDARSLSGIAPAARAHTMRGYALLGSGGVPLRSRRRRGFAPLAGLGASGVWNCTTDTGNTSTGKPLSASDCAIAMSVINSMSLPWGQTVTANATLVNVVADNVADPTLPSFFTNPSGCYTPSVLAAEDGTPGTASLVKTSSGIGLSIAAAAGVATGGITALAGTLVGLFTALLDNHIKHDETEQNAICPAVPACLEAYQAIIAGVGNGTITPAQGSAGLTQLMSEFKSAVSPGLYMDSTQCSAGCIYILTLAAAIAKMQALFAQGLTIDSNGEQIPVASQPAPIVSAGSVATSGAVTSATGALEEIPGWVLIALAAGAVMLVL